MNKKYTISSFSSSRKKFEFKPDEDSLLYISKYLKILSICLQSNIGMNLIAKTYNLIPVKKLLENLETYTQRIVNYYKLNEYLRLEEYEDVVNTMTSLSIIIQVLILNSVRSINNQEDNNLYGNNNDKNNDDNALQYSQIFVELLDQQCFITYQLSTNDTIFDTIFSYILEYFIPLLNIYMENYFNQGFAFHTITEAKQNSNAQTRLKLYRLSHLFYYKCNEFIIYQVIDNAAAMNYKRFCENFNYKIPSKIKEILDAYNAKHNKSPPIHPLIQEQPHSLEILDNKNNNGSPKHSPNVSFLSNSFINLSDKSPISSIISLQSCKRASGILTDKNPPKSLLGSLRASILKRIAIKKKNSIPRDEFTLEEKWLSFINNFRIYTKETKATKANLNALSNSIVNFSEIFASFEDKDKDKKSFFITKEDIILKLLNYLEFWRQRNGSLIIVKFILRALGQLIILSSRTFLNNVFSNRNIIKAPIRSKNEAEIINYQNLFDKLNAPRIIISLILSDKDDNIDYLYSLFKFMILLLYGGNKTIQKGLYDYFYNNPVSEKFFHKLNNLIMKEIARNNMSELAKHADDPKEIKYFSMVIMRFLQLFCEGHYLKLQDYLRIQTKSKNSYDLITMTVKLLTSFKISSENYVIVLQCFDTLTEFIQGPCKNNQRIIVESKFLEYAISLLNEDWKIFKCNKVNEPEKINAKTNGFTLNSCYSQKKGKKDYIENIDEQEVMSTPYTRGPIHHHKINIKSYQISQLKYKCLITLISLLEGNSDSSEGLKSRISKIIPIQILTNNLIQVYEHYKKLYPHNEYNENLFNHIIQEKDMDSTKSIEYYELIIENGFNVYILINMFLDEYNRNHLSSNDDKDNCNEYIHYQNKEKSSTNNLFNKLNKFGKSILNMSNLNILLDLKKKLTLSDHAMFESDLNINMQELERNLHKEQLIKEAVNFFRHHTRHIEIIRNDKIEKLYFPLLPLCKVLPKEYKRAFHDNVDRTSTKTKLYSLMKSSKEFIQVMKHEEKLRLLFNQALIIKLIATNGVLWEHLTFYINIFLNLVILVSYSYEFGNHLKTPRLFFNPQNQHTDKLILILGLADLIFSALVVASTLIKRVPLVIKPIWKGYNKLTLRKKISKFIMNMPKSLWYCIKDFYFSYYTLFIIASILGIVIHPFCFVLQLFDILRNGMLKNVIYTVWIPKYTILLTFFLMLLAIYYFTLVGYNYYGNHYETADDCKQLWQCYLRTMTEAFQNTGAIGKYLINPEFIEGLDQNGNVISEKGVYSLDRFFFDNLFYLIVIVIALGLIASIIINTFQALREVFDKKINDMTRVCFICGIDSSIIDKNSDKKNGFHYHVENDHHIWDYLYFIAYLESKKATEYTGQESYIKNKIMNSDLSWFPINRALCMNNDLRVKEKTEIMNRIIENMTRLKNEVLINSNKLQKIIDDDVNINHYDNDDNYNKTVNNDSNRYDKVNITSRVKNKMNNHDN